jgi:hypothetical protein
MHIPRNCGRFAAAVTVWMFAGALVAFGQQITGSVTGSVQDPSGAAVVGATVTLTNTGTSVSRTTQSDGSGNFQFLLLPPGNYLLEASNPGFRTFRRDGIVVEADRSLAVPVTLSLGQVTETVEVTAGTPLLEPNTSSLGTVMDRRKVEDLPLSGRNPMGLANLIPTVRGVGFFGGQVLSSWRTAAVNIGGGQPVSNGFMIDGMANDKIGDAAGAMTFLTVDATQEFKVITNAMSAEFGRSGGGIISVISRSGTNEFHGNLFEYLRSENLNANDFFANRSGAPRAPLIFNQFGGTLGGPIKRDKVFFFANYEGYRERRSQTRVITSPTALERNGDFSDTRTAAGQLIRIYDPLTTASNPSQPGAFIRQQFLNNVIPASRISVLSREIFKLFPQGNLPGLPFTRAQNLFQVGSTPISRDTWGIKVDYNVSDNRRLAVRYTRDNINPWRFANFFGNLLEDDGRLIGIPRHSSSLQYTDSLTPTLLLDVKSGYNYDGEFGHGPWSDPEYANTQLTAFGFPASFADQLYKGRFTPRGGFPQLNVGDLLNMAGHGDQVRAGSAWANSLALTRLQGSHTIKTGYQYTFYTFNSSGTTSGSATFTFNRGFTQGPDPNRATTDAGYGVASFLLGTPASGTNVLPPENTLGQHYHALFVQDDWKATRRLTLNLGLRWEYEGPLTDRYDIFTNFDPSIESPLRVPGFPLQGGAVYPATQGGPRGFTETSYRRFAPRLGFALQARNNFVVRGGYGITFIPTKGTSLGTIGAFTGFRAETPMVTSLDGGLTPHHTVSNPFPAGVEQPTGSRLGALSGIGSAMQAQYRDVIPGYLQQWNFTLQYEPWANWLLEGAYVGSKGTHLLTIESRDFYRLHPQYLALGNDLVRSVPNPFFGIIPTGPLSAATIPYHRLLRAHPQFASIAGGHSFLGDSIYHAFALKVEKRFSRGFSLLAAYTASKLIDAAAGSGGTTRPGGAPNTGILDWYDLRRERSKGIEDIPQRLVFTALWELPFARTATGWQRHVLGGWQVNAITTIQSGSPIALTAPGTSGVIGANRPNVVAGVNPKLENPAIDKWFNTDAFSVPAPFTFGNASRTLPNVLSDGAFNVDLSLFKDFRVTERVKLQLRGEAFNLTNTPTFEVPVRDVNSRTFGVVTATAFYPKPREIQLALQLTF